MNKNSENKETPTKTIKSKLNGGSKLSAYHYKPSLTIHKTKNPSNFAFYTPKTTNKSGSDAFRSLFLSHYVKNSYQKQTCSSKAQLSQQPSINYNSFETKCSFLEKKINVEKKIDCFLNEYKRKLYQNMYNENDYIDREESTSRNSFFKNCYKILEGLKPFFTRNSDEKGEKQKSFAREDGKDVFYFLYKIDEFLKEKSKILHESSKIGIKKEEIKEIFTFIFENLRFLIQILIKFDNVFGYVLTNVAYFFMGLIEKLLDIEGAHKLDQAEGKADINEESIKENLMTKYAIDLKYRSFLEKEKNKWMNEYSKLKKDFSQRYNDLLNENLELQQNIQKFQEKIEEFTQKDNVENAFDSLKNDIHSIDHLLINLNKEQQDQNRIYTKGLKSMLDIMKEKQIKNNAIQQKELQKNPFPLLESKFYDFPNKIQKFIQHPFKPFLLTSFNNFSYELLENLSDEKIKHILMEFFINWEKEEDLNIMTMPTIRFLDFMLVKQQNIFLMSWNLTHICNFLKSDSEKKHSFSIFFSKLFLLAKSKPFYIDKDSLFYFLIFKKEIIKQYNENLENKEFYLQYDKIITIFREIYQNYEIHDSFLNIFEKISQQYIVKNYVILGYITKKFDFPSKNDAINHLELILERTADNNTKRINYSQFKEIIFQTYDINVEANEIYEEIKDFLVEKQEFTYIEFINQLRKGLVIEFFRLNNLVFDALCMISQKNKESMILKIFSENYEKKSLFRYSQFKAEFCEKFDRIGNFFPQIFSSVYYENYFFKIYDYIKKKKQQISFQENINIPENFENCIDFSDFYSKNKMWSNFEELFEFIEFISALNCEYIPPKKLIKKQNNNISLGNFSVRTNSSDSSKNQRRKSLQKRSSIMMKNTFSQRKSTAFSGIQLILAKKPFKKSK